MRQAEGRRPEQEPGGWRPSVSRANAPAACVRAGIRLRDPARPVRRWHTYVGTGAGFGANNRKPVPRHSGLPALFHQVDHGMAFGRLAIDSEFACVGSSGVGQASRRCSHASGINALWQAVAERVGFEPTDRLLARHSISSRARYDLFGTSPERKAYQNRRASPKTFVADAPCYDTRRTAERCPR